MADFYVAEGSDDAYEDKWAMRPAETTVRVRSWTDPTDRYHGGYRFPNVTIPQGSTILTASLSIYTWTESYDDMNCKVYGNDVDDALNFLDEGDIDGRTMTDAFVSWVEDALGIGWKTKTGLDSIIQEIVNRGGWASGNALVLLLIGNTDVDKTCSAYSFNQDPSYAAKLSVTWTPPVTGGGVKPQMLVLTL